MSAVINVERDLTELDKGKVADFLLSTQEAIETSENPSSRELVQRRLAVQRIREEVKALLASRELNTETEADWRGFEDIVSRLLLENFTRQVGTDDRITIVGLNAVKDHHYIVPSGTTERRTYMGLHRKSYDNDGLSVVTASKPTLHEQPFHAHAVSDENSLAIHPTHGLAFLNGNHSSQAFTLAARPGQMLHFSTFTPHTLLNPNLHPSVDVSIKVPEALGDRISLNPKNIGDHLVANRERVMKAMFQKPHLKNHGEGYKETVYTIENCGRRYFVHFLKLDPGVTYEIARQEDIAPDSLELMQGFAGLGSLNVDVRIDDGADHSHLAFGEFAVVPRVISSYSATNLRKDAPVLLYRAYEVPATQEETKSAWGELRNLPEKV